MGIFSSFLSGGKWSEVPLFSQCLHMPKATSPAPISHARLFPQRKDKGARHNSAARSKVPNQRNARKNCTVLSTWSRFRAHVLLQIYNFVTNYSKKNLIFPLAFIRICAKSGEKKS